MSQLFKIWAADTSAATGPPSLVATSGTINLAKTLLQVAPLVDCAVVEWGYTFDVAPSSNLRMELVETGLIPAMVTTIGSGILHYDNPGSGTVPSVCFTIGTAATGFNASAEGTITASRLGEFHYENGLYLEKQFPLKREFEIPAGHFLRVRATPTASAAVNVMPYVLIEV